MEVDAAKAEYTTAFFVAPNAGYKKEEFKISVRNAKHLDYEDPIWAKFQFKVSDGKKYHKQFFGIFLFQLHVEGILDPKKEDQVLINIALIDYNDEWPIFKHSEYSVNINETAKKGVSIITITATDRDAEDKVLE